MNPAHTDNQLSRTVDHWISTKTGAGHSGRGQQWLDARALFGLISQSFTYLTIAITTFLIVPLT